MIGALLAPIALDVVLDFIPGVGEVKAFAETIYELLQGNYVSGFISFLGGIAGIVPIGDLIKNIPKLEKAGDAIHAAFSIITPLKAVASNVFGLMKFYVKNGFEFAMSSGKLMFKKGTILALEVKGSLVKAWKGLLNTGLKTDTSWLKRANKWLDEGGDFVESNGKIWYKKGGDDIFEIRNQKILPNKKEHYYQGSGGTPIGEPTNGYQVVKVGDDIKVKRIPDESPYQSSELNKLIDHPDAHVLERDGHDVTDDALNKRATEGIAPDGSTTQSGNPPPYSSKFESPDKIKEVLNNVGPGSPNWNPPSSGNSYAFDYPLSGSAPNSFGYGIPSGGGSPVSMNRVKVVYKKDGGVWKLLTMYPQP